MTIRELRDRTGLSQDRFAEKYHLSASTLRKWESGVRPCPEYVQFSLPGLVLRDYPDVTPAGPDATFDEIGVQDGCKYYKSCNRDVVYAALVEQFGESDVRVDYRSKRYPFPCDFYIKSRDLYIELHDFNAHGHHWFDKASLSDRARLKMMFERGGIADNYFVNADIWGRIDTSKRWYAARAGLNYVVFWESDLSDALLWFCLNCPDGRDWEREYSWLTEPGLDGCHNYIENMSAASEVIYKAWHEINFGA